MDPLEAAFLFCFVFGVAMSALSFLLGTLGLPGSDAGDSQPELGDVPDGIDAGEVADAGLGDSDLPEHPARQTPSPVNVNTATAFLAFFGGIGYVLNSALGAAAAISMIGGAAAGLVGGAVVHPFLIKILLRGQRFLDPADYRLEGSIATVSRAIRADGTGEIIYVKGGTRRSEGARTTTRESIPEGTEVVIVRYENGIAFVEPWASYARES